MDFLDKIQNKKILVVGLGKTGRATLEMLEGKGCELYAQDSKTREQMDESLVALIDRSCKYAFLGYVPDETKFDYVIMSPGVSPELEFVKKAEQAGAELIGELELAYRLCKGIFVAITGTNGKTTTTSLVGEIFERSKRKTSVVGNIGKAVIGAAIDATKDDWLVTEVSSFQLETTREFRPLVSAILNLTPDHLNRHHTMEAYGAAKAKIFANQSKDQYLIINYDDKLCFDLAKDAECTVVPFSRKSKLDYGVILENNKIYVNDKNNKVYICDKGDIRIIGDHNVENVLAAVGICYFAGIDKEVIAEGIRNFGGVEHRIEFCAEIR